MAKVIFALNNTGNIEFQENGGFAVNMNVRLEESSPEDQTGPHDVMAGIIKSMAPEIIKSDRGVVEISQGAWAGSRGGIIQL